MVARGWAQRFSQTGSSVEVLGAWDVELHTGFFRRGGWGRGRVPGQSDCILDSGKSGLTLERLGD